MHYSTVLWDWNGTILNDLEMCHGIYQKVAQQFSFNSLTLEQYRERFCFPLSRFYEINGFDGNLAELAKVSLSCFEEGVYECQLQEGVVEFLQFLHELGIEQHVVSAHNHDDLNEMVRRYGLEKYFTSINGLKTIQGGSKISLAKEIAKEQNFNLSETVLIGDTLHDYDVACSLGVDSWLVAQGHVSLARLAQCDTARTFNSLVGLTRSYRTLAA